MRLKIVELDNYLLLALVLSLVMVACLSFGPGCLFAFVQHCSMFQLMLFDLKEKKEEREERRMKCTSWKEDAMWAACLRSTGEGTLGVCVWAWTGRDFR